jgi:hypothetical protein
MFCSFNYFWLELVDTFLMVRSLLAGYFRRPQANSAAPPNSTPSSTLIIIDSSFRQSVAFLSASSLNRMRIQVINLSNLVGEIDIGLIYIY